MKPSSRLPSLLLLPSLALLCLTFTTLLTPTRALLCWTNFCNPPGWCVQSCEPADRHCLAQYRQTSSGHLAPSYFGCHATDEICDTNCEPVPGDGGTFDCCCSSDLCNSVDGLTPEGDEPTSPPNPGSLPPVSGNDGVQTCEAYNCSGLDLDHEDCFYGYHECPHPANGSAYCAATYTFNSDSHLYELGGKKCITQNFNCDEGSHCEIDTSGDGSPKLCCCAGDLCNVDVTFTNPERVNLSVVDPCIGLDCHHSCITHDGQSSCYCRAGYALDTDEKTCVDIDECNFNNGGCSHECFNEDGSYVCLCPSDMKLGEDGLTCETTGLICYSHSCNGTGCHSEFSLQYCDEVENSDTPHCQATYRRLEDGTFEPRLLSCFAGSFTCTPGVCIATESRKKDIYYCCCDGNYCNSNVTFVNSTVDVTSTSFLHPLATPTHVTGSGSPTNNPTPAAKTPSSISQSKLTFIIVVVLSVTLLIPVVAVGVTCVYCMHKKSKMYRIASQTSLDRERFNSPDLAFSELSFIDKIGQGRFAAVWRAKLIEDEVAVKVFPNTPQSHESWCRECEIYETPELEHKYILSFRGSHQKDNELWIITDYYSLGSLHDLLKRQTVTLKQFCELAESAAVGLAHLHDQRIVDGITKKPSIAHRDLKSKNILVRNDFTCIISDFGLAIKFLNEESSSDAHGQVGTSRYMAPEVLEGAISFQREAYLRIDVYAFALILWEIASRTSLENNASVKQYRSPFDEYVSPNPSIEEMKDIVVTQFKRPAIPKGFTTSGEYDCLQDTIEESWDQEPEARLSAQCIAERIRTFKLSKFGSKDSGLTHSPTENTYNSDSLDSQLGPTTPSLTSSVTMSPMNSKHMLDSGTESMGVYPNRALSNETVRLGNTSSSGLSPFHAAGQRNSGNFHHYGNGVRYHRSSNRIMYSSHSTETTV